MKKLLLLNGLGFSSDEFFESSAQEMGIEVVKFNPMASTDAVDLEALLSNVGLILLRSPFSFDVENSIYVRVLHQKLSKLLAKALDTELDVNLVGVGRGAFLLLEHITDGAWRGWRWMETFRDSGPMVGLDLFLDSGMKQHLAKFDGWCPTGYDRDLGDWDTFCRYQDALIGWKYKKAYICLADIFASHGRYQMDAFGYERAKELSLGCDVWKEFLNKCL